jgi:hypothetical protein
VLHAVLCCAAASDEGGDDEDELMDLVDEAGSGDEGAGDDDELCDEGVETATAGTKRKRNSSKVREQGGNGKCCRWRAVRVPGAGACTARGQLHCFSAVLCMVAVSQGPV